MTENTLEYMAYSRPASREVRFPEYRERRPRIVRANVQSWIASQLKLAGIDATLSGLTTRTIRRAGGCREYVHGVLAICQAHSLTRYLVSPPQSAVYRQTIGSLARARAVRIDRMHAIRALRDEKAIPTAVYRQRERLVLTEYAKAKASLSWRTRWTELYAHASIRGQERLARLWARYELARTMAREDAQAARLHTSTYSVSVKTEAEYIRDRYRDIIRTAIMATRRLRTAMAVYATLAGDAATEYWQTVGSLADASYDSVADRLAGIKARIAGASRVHPAPETVKMASRYLPAGADVLAGRHTLLYSYIAGRFVMLLHNDRVRLIRECNKLRTAERAVLAAQRAGK